MSGCQGVQGPTCRLGFPEKRGMHGAVAMGWTEWARERVEKHSWCRGSRGHRQKGWVEGARAVRGPWSASVHLCSCPFLSGTCSMPLHPCSK